MSCFIEISVSYIPASVLDKLLYDFKELFKEKFIFSDEVDVFGTNQRIILDIKDTEKQKVLRKKLFGPSEKVISNNPKALDGFLKKLNSNREDIVIESGQAVLNIEELITLEENIEESINYVFDNIEFDKKMVWSGIPFIRPVRNIVAFHNRKKLDIKIGDLTSNELVKIGQKSYTISSYTNYFDIIKNIKVTKESRLKAIEPLINETFNEHVNNFEKPKYVLCPIPEKYLELPKKIIEVTIDKHQAGAVIEKEFAVLAEAWNSSEAVREGNVRVVNSRLEDASFFYKQDREKSLEYFVHESNNRALAKGNIKDKLDRISKALIKLGYEEYLEIVPYLKFDLATNIVKEKDYQLLRGYIGSIYAKDLKNSSLIYEHYLPRFPGDEMPSAEGAILALLDKMDNVFLAASSYSLPTGAKDPMYIRRDAIGALQIIDYFDLNINILELASFFKVDVTEFMKSRVLSYLSNKYDKSIINSVLDFWYDLRDVKLRCEALSSFSLEKLKNDYFRVSNILSKGGSGSILDELEEEEQKLLNKVNEISEFIDSSTSYIDSLEEIKKVSPYLETFFDKIIVFVDDEKVRRSRLAILSKVSQLFNRIASFEALIKG